MREGGGDSVNETCWKAPSRAVIEAVAEAEGVSPAEIRPPAYQSLHAAVDPEALDALFAMRSDGTPRPGGAVTFPFCGYEVTVAAGGDVCLEKLPESTKS